MTNFEDDITVMAKHLAATAIVSAIEDGSISHEDWPEVGVNDWGLISNRMVQIADQVAAGSDDYYEVYLKLAQRATTTMTGK